MTRFKKIFCLYLLFGIVLAICFSSGGSFTLLTVEGGLSVFDYILFIGILLGLLWLPYSIFVLLSPYTEYYIVSDTPLVLIIYILAFCLICLFIILKKQKLDAETKTPDNKQ